MGSPPPIAFPDGRELTFERTRVMGVLNVTPDSFSDGGRYLEPAVAIERGLELVAAGADIVDIGGESTRPGSAAVSPGEQLRRVLPVIAGLRRECAALISIDTTSAEVAREALSGGADLINDISAFRFDEGMLPLLAERAVPAVAMHTLAEPATMQRAPSYDDVVAEVTAHLAARLAACEQAGVEPSRIIVDPGIGFGKTLEHNLLLLRGLPRLAELGRPVLVGTSRKSFLGALTGRPAGERLSATAGSVAAAIVLGANLVRVHDVPELVDTIAVADAIAHAEAPGRRS